MSNIVEPTEEQRLAAKRGAHLLDERMPGWAKRINPATLDMGSGCQCVLGQTYGEYEDGVQTLDLGAAYMFPKDQSPPVVHHGFFAEGVVGERDWRGLSAAWLEQIAERAK